MNCSSFVLGHLLQTSLAPSLTQQEHQGEHTVSLGLGVTLPSYSCWSQVAAPF